MEMLGREKAFKMGVYHFQSSSNPIYQLTRIIGE